MISSLDRVLLVLFIIAGMSCGTTRTASAYDLPTIQDEKDTYDRWGWDWSSAIQPTSVAERYSGTYYVSDPNVHGDTEADDLWTYRQMVIRGGNSLYTTRAGAWLRYFKEDYRSCAGGQDRNFCYDVDVYGGDHMYGYGLIAEYEYSSDADALKEAVAIGGVLESLYDAEKTTFGCLPKNACTHYGYRRPGRHLILAARLYDVTKDQRWAVLRDKILTLLLASSDWSQTYGMYFSGEWETDYKWGAGSYSAGYRGYWPPGIAILSEGLWHVWRTTRNESVKQRLISMARFVSSYGLDPTMQYAGAYAGVDPSGNPYHTGFSSANYTNSLVNLLVIGYKLTGDREFLEKAKFFFNRGTKGVYGSPYERLCADDQVHHFVDTVFASSTEYFYLDSNKTELFYTYLIFENGGEPTVESSLPKPSAPQNLRIAQ